MVSSLALNEFTESFSNRSKCIFPEQYMYMKASSQDNNHFTYTASSFCVHCFLLRAILQTTVLRNFTLPTCPVKVKLCSDILTSNNFFLNAEEFVSVFQQRCEHKASQCNKSYRLPEIEHALWFMSLRTLKRFMRVPLLM